MGENSNASQYINQVRLYGYCYTIMNSLNVEQLNKKFSIGLSVDEKKYNLRFILGAGDIPQIEIQNKLASATISLQGAHLLSWVPVGCKEVIWVSKEASFLPGKSIRGGAPVCWPWFGAHESNAAFPAHGFARTSMWQVSRTQQLSTGATQVTLKLDTSELDEQYQLMWPTATVVEFILTVSNTLTIELTTYNNSDQTISIGQALHTYFSIDDVTNTGVHGLHGKYFLDKTDGFKQKLQSGPVVIDAEVDRVYLQTADELIVDDEKRKIKISKRGSQTTIVWNPWKDVAAKMGDLGHNGYLKMLCVESANAADDIVNISAGDQNTLVIKYELL